MQEGDAAWLASKGAAQRKRAWMSSVRWSAVKHAQGAGAEGARANPIRVLAAGQSGFAAGTTRRFEGTATTRLSTRTSSISSVHRFGCFVLRPYSTIVAAESPCCALTRGAMVTPPGRSRRRCGRSHRH